jgi:hypothetical protein
MTLVAAAVCPHPPLLVPEVASGAAGELDPLRAACRAAVTALGAASPDLLVVVGAAAAAGHFDGAAAGSLAAYGVDVVVGDGDPILPLSLTIGRWLLDAAPCDVERGFVAVAFDTEPVECAALGERLAGAADRVALLVMGDGSARRAEKAPGHLDPRAEGFDADVARAFSTGDAAALLALDPHQASDLLVAGRGPWQVLAGAAAGGQWAAEVTYDAAPYGVEYLVAIWR